MAVDRGERPRLHGKSLELKRVCNDSGRDRVDLPLASDADDFLCIALDLMRSLILQLVQKRVHAGREAQTVRRGGVPQVVFAARRNTSMQTSL